MYHLLLKIVGFSNSLGCHCCWQGCHSPKDSSLYCSFFYPVLLCGSLLGFSKFSAINGGDWLLALFSSICWTLCFILDSSSTWDTHSQEKCFWIYQDIYCDWWWDSSFWIVFLKFSIIWSKCLLFLNLAIWMKWICFHVTSLFCWKSTEETTIKWLGDMGESSDYDN